jgi:hypothetical protein
MSIMRRSMTATPAAAAAALVAVVVVVMMATMVTVISGQSLRKGPLVNNVHKELVNLGVVLPQRISRNKFNAQIYPTANTTFFAGQEVRMRVSTVYFNLEKFRYSTYATGSQYFQGDHAHNYKLKLSDIHVRRAHGRDWFQNRTYLNETYFPSFNISGPSGVRVRVVAAYSSRTASTGQQLSCHQATDVWQEFWGMSGRSTAWGRDMAFSAYVTINVPPFAWKVCIKDTSDKNTTRDGRSLGTDTTSTGWGEFENDPGVLRFREPLFLWFGSTTMTTGDYAAISVVTNGRGDYNLWNGKAFDPYDFSVNWGNSLIGDQMKFVPAGFPCTYEKSSASADVVHNAQNRWKLEFKHQLILNNIVEAIMSSQHLEILFTLDVLKKDLSNMEYSRLEQMLVIHSKPMRLLVLAHL